MRSLGCLFPIPHPRCLLWRGRIHARSCRLRRAGKFCNYKSRPTNRSFGSRVFGPPPSGRKLVRQVRSQGLSFVKAPVIMPVFGQPSSPDELLLVALRAVRFTGLAAGLPDFGFNTESPVQLKVAVDQMINTHIFSQFVGGISSAERRYQLLESHSLVRRHPGASCVRFDAKVEVRGFYKALPRIVVVLNFINNLICAHPQPASAKSRLIWISFVEAYREGEESAADTVRREVDPFLQSLQFMPRR
jgi:hypothetical protein